ncbi:unnamed protein product [Vicia faba]|uniref:Uncharacterized protein n=1 Tax=Vicia faba TaxID=3906 RepID=A0AAV1AP72_VICFA|nr:unnamed protein product [Vicia faba]
MAAALSHADANTDAVGEDEYKIVHFTYSINKHSIKKIPTGNIYKQTLLSGFNFTKNYKIITAKKKLYIHENHCEDIYLLSRDNIRSYRSKYQFLHIGLVQFSIEMNPWCDRRHMRVRLRDSKYSNVGDSILVCFETPVKEGSMKFNWFPNFSTTLFDLGNSNGLIVTIDPSDSTDLTVKYRVCYKLMKKALKPDYLFGNPVVEVNTEITNFVVPQIS